MVAGGAKRHRVSFIGGDFNMALFQAEETMRERGLEAVFLGSYAWREKITRGSGESPVPGLGGARYDSLALFAVEPVSTLTRVISPSMLRGEGESALHEFVQKKAQGYQAHSYKGGEVAILAAFEPWGPSTHGSGDNPLPHIKQKVLRPEVWDATGILSGRGAHMPLLWYVGDISGRSNAALVAREKRMTQRGWGPGSANRARLMRAQGKGKNAGQS